LRGEQALLGPGLGLRGPVARPALVVGRQEAVRVDGGLRHRVGPLQRRERHGPPLPLPPRLRDVGQDPEDPGLQRGARLETVDPGEDADPRLLDDLLGDRPARDVDLRDPEERSVVHPHQLLEGPLVACAQRLDEPRVVEQVGPNVPDTIRPCRYVVASVRRPGSSIYGKIGLQDFTTDDVYFERGINLLHGYLTEYYVEDSNFVFALPETLREVGVLPE